MLPNVPLSDLFQPQVVIPGVAQRATIGTGIMRSGIVARSPELDAILKGGGKTLKIPSFTPLRRRGTVQKKNTGPEIGNVSETLAEVPRLQRELAFGIDAITAALSLQDPMQHIINGLGDNRVFDRQCVLQYILRGLFGKTPNAAFASISKNAAVEDITAIKADNLLDSDLLSDAFQILGELKELLLAGGGILCHSAIAEALRKQDQISFIQPSAGKVTLEAWRQRAIFVSDALARPTADGKGLVYETYLFAPGVIAMGDLPQTTTIGDTSSLILAGDPEKNNQIIYDRTDFYIAPAGAKWQPKASVPAGETPTDDELADEANWKLGVENAKTIGIVRVLTNG